MRCQSSMRSIALLLVAAVACGDRRPPVSVTPPPTAIDAGVAADGGVAIVTPPFAADPAVRIAPHAAQIVATALDPTGTAAVTLDVIGDVRLWRRLDGTRPPIALPFHGARALELTIDQGDFVIGRIDPAGAAHFYRLDADGKLVATGSAAAVPQAIGLVSAGGRYWSLVRADHAIVLVDDRGAQHHELARDGVRIEALRPLIASTAIAIVSRDRDGDLGYDAVTIGRASQQLTWGKPIALPIAPLRPVEVAASPDGRRLAYFADPAAVAAAAATPAADPKGKPSGPRPSRRRPPQEPTTVAVIVVVDLATGAVVTPKDLVATQLTIPQRVGFSSNDSLHGFGAGSGDLTVGLDADADVVAGNLLRSSAPAVGPGVIASGYDRNLLVQQVGGDTRYLGYQLATPSLAAMTPDGARVAWATSDGQILIETIDGSAPEVMIDGGSGAVVALEFLDAARLVVVTQQAELKLFDAARGTELAAMTAPGAAYAVQINRRTGWIASLRDGGGIWALRVTAAADRPWTAPKIIADGSSTFWLLDAADDDAPALVTVDGNLRARRYNAAQLAAGVSAAKVGKIAKEVLPQMPAYVDPTGRPYLYVGAEVRVGAMLGHADAPLLLLSSPRDLARSPDGSVLIAFDQERTAFAVGPDGSERWSLGVGAPGWRPAFSLDGRRVALVSGGGGQIVDVATGAVVIARCGWRFGAFPTAPSGFAQQVHPICE